MYDFIGIICHWSALSFAIGLHFYFCICMLLAHFPSFVRAGSAVVEWLSSWLAEQEVRGSNPRLAT